MGFIHGANRHEAILFPERLDDYLAAENPVRFLDAFVDHLDLTTLGFQRATPAATGRPADDPAELLKLDIYGDLDRLRSSRRLAQETHRNGELMGL
jgi:transposase